MLLLSTPFAISLPQRKRTISIDQPDLIAFQSTLQSQKATFILYGILSKIITQKANTWPKIQATSPQMSVTERNQEQKQSMIFMRVQLSKLKNSN